MTLTRGADPFVTAIENTTPHMKRLEYDCKFINISVAYGSGRIVWPNCASEFRVDDDVKAKAGYALSVLPLLFISALSPLFASSRS